ncbi:MAG TPA: glycoside hydrolase family 31 protein [Rectinemataceae bacterium]|nr:glycoside hydrolase family 31 protein [Rectinemataceae bacterium]
MNLRKIETPENFVYVKSGIAGGWVLGDEEFRIELEAMGFDIFRYRVSSPRWPRGSPSQAGLSIEGVRSGAETISRAGAEAAGDDFTVICAVDAGGAPRLEINGVELLAPLGGRGFGVCGSKWLLAFRHDEDTLFFGMGEKNLGAELSAKRTRFWNTDLFADFPMCEIVQARADPLYISLPVLYLSRGGFWAALVLDAPAAPFINTGAIEGIFDAGSTPFERSLSMGAKDGAPDLWIIAGRDPADIARKVQSLQGRTPLPPLWALGHHQCRWGYRGIDEVKAIAEGYDDRGIPNDGIWLDIDSMEGFRVFSVGEGGWKGTEEAVASLGEKGFRVVPILDPGIRRDPEFPVYAEAKRQDILCKTPEGEDYIGFVWPGYAVFPDFSMSEGRAFWAREVERYAKQGFAGFWIDMNDPATGSAPTEDMLFGRGSTPHLDYHNQYALGMAMATRSGLETARPGERPFVISRSAWLGQAPHSAVWTGDNISNAAHLAACIPVSLNLSISGLPFNGPDVPGFGGNADADLARAWYKACFLFPFLRNHRIKGAVDQEPWAFGPQTEGVIVGLIRSRYRLLPYLYNLFIEQEESGDPIMRPLWFLDIAAARVADEFLVGPSILQAPILDPEAASRPLMLPAREWFELARGALREGGGTISVRQGYADTPLFLACPSLIPLLHEETRRAGAARLDRIDILAIVSNGSKVEYRYRFDDGATDAWRKGERSEYLITVAASESILRVSLRKLKDGAGALRCRIAVPASLGFGTIEVEGRSLRLDRESLALAGSKLKVLVSEELVV